jgi:hypothetical protein
MIDESRFSFYEIYRKKKHVFTLRSVVDNDDKPFDPSRTQRILINYVLLDKNNEILIKDVSKSFLVGGMDIKTCAKKIDDMLQAYGKKKTLELLKIDKL